MSGNRNKLLKQVKKLYAYLNDYRKQVGYKVVNRQKTITYRFCLSSNLDMLQSHNYKLLLDDHEVDELLKLDYLVAYKILYDKLVDLFNSDKQEREELYAS